MKKAGMILRLVQYGALIVMGAYILFGFVNPVVTQWWIPFIIVIAGIFILQGGNVLPGAIMVAIGLYLIARDIGLITTPILRYAMGSTVALIGSLGLLRELRAPKQQYTAAN